MLKLRVKPTRFPRKFVICVNFKPTQSKGVFVSHDAKGESLVGLPGKPGPDPAAVRKAANALSMAKRPLIAIGGGTVAASEDVVALAEKLACPVVNTVNAKGVA